MPTYSYRCTECDTAFDIQQAFTDDTLTECPSCGGKLRKVFSSIGVSFTGSGFYQNDARSDAKSAQQAKTKPSPTPAEKNSTSSLKSETKSSSPAAPPTTIKSAATPAAP
ncbi:putative FmdB family regulatory protein [Cryobacterium sp. MP_M5]|uniref:FmdB family zinc ribbon protein n=1 Tax=unclassified Cryobacterium TaxID=2649013 RepID=UPI0018C9ACB1|nr:MULTISPECIES: FmdB family zinc ribbon protein [unclassified Cryobacterium]MBG6058832.1 putative FmdB family regulatory protein [Cryobacterium sp. MP_M3]MEC5177159.1 putative FmdB family regulatory protein [Cryobacterium sp. MP_M5]